MMTLPTGKARSERCVPGAFTLIELILVMAVLAIVLAITAPSLANFFRGRNLDSEVTRFLSLTRYGQSRAVSEGYPMRLWIDTSAGTYGLEAETGYLDSDDKAVEFQIAKELRMELTTSTTTTLPADKNGVAIHFLPDGTIGLNSPTGVTLQEGETRPVEIVLSADGLNYEIENQNETATRAAR